MASHREPLPPGQPEPGELPVEPDNGAIPPLGVPAEERPNDDQDPVAPV